MKYNRMILFLLVFIVSIVSIMSKSFLFNPCKDTLTDEEYIQHMIPHHEVAVYMSQNHLNNTTNPIILNILRNIIRIQTYEINTMKDASIKNVNVNYINDEMSLNEVKMNKTYKASQGDFTPPNKYAITNTFCDPSFFNINHNSHMIEHMTDEMYIKHMIPHHQVAVDMSKRILKTTTNDFIIYLAYRIIRAQQSEIAELYNLANSKYIYQSDILSTTGKWSEP